MMQRRLVRSRLGCVKFVRTVVRDELATILLSFAKAVDAQLGAEVAVAPGD
jgi:hypothetical protein